MPKKEPSRLKSSILFIIAFLLLGTGSYLLLLLQSPAILQTQPSSAKSDENTLVNQGTNFVKIERINTMVPFYEGTSESILEKGAWHRHAERGDPEKGGNFILSAHRFRMGLTPNQTKERSPFYYLDKVQVDDMVDIFYKGKWYSYKVVKTYSVQPDAVEIEDPSDNAKLTLYTCSLKGSADGRVVVEAVPVARTTQQEDSDKNLLL